MAGRPLSTEFDVERNYLRTYGHFASMNSQTLWAAPVPVRGSMSAKTYAKVLRAVKADFAREYARMQHHFPAHGGFRVRRDSFYTDANGQRWFVITAHKRS